MTQCRKKRETKCQNCHFIKIRNALIAKYGRLKSYREFAVVADALEDSRTKQWQQPY